MDDFKHRISHEELMERDIRILVAGSRFYSNKERFDAYIHNYLNLYKGAGSKNIAFVSGMASTGADDLIIGWCEANGYKWAGYPANWQPDPSNPKYTDKAAGYKRNAQMGNVATDAVIFWDFISRGTKNMIDILVRKQIYPTIHVIPFHSLEKGNSWGSVDI